MQRSSYIAILFLRIFIGCIMLMHIMGILQDYDNLVETYKPFLGLGHATSLAVMVICESILAVMLILGIAVRFSALVMIAASVITLIEAGMLNDITSANAKLSFIYLGIYVTLAISGGGDYSISQLLSARKSVPKG